VASDAPHTRRSRFAIRPALSAGDALAWPVLQVLLGGLALFAFNALLEIPHFFRYHPSDTVDASTVEVLSIFECFHDRDSPLWIKRLPFFFSYFFGCSWFSAALSYRYLRRGMGSAALKQA